MRWHRRLPDTDNVSSLLAFEDETFDLYAQDRIFIIISEYWEQLKDDHNYPWYRHRVRVMSGSGNIYPCDDKKRQYLLGPDSRYTYDSIRPRAPISKFRFLTPGVKLYGRP